MYSAYVRELLNVNLTYVVRTLVLRGTYVRTRVRTYVRTQFVIRIDVFLPNIRTYTGLRTYVRLTYVCYSHWVCYVRT